MNRKVLMERLHAVEKEHRVATLSVAEFRAEAGRDPTVLAASNVPPGDVAACEDNLEATYLVPLFAG